MVEHIVHDKTIVRLKTQCCPQQEKGTKEILGRSPRGILCEVLNIRLEK